MPRARIVGLCVFLVIAGLLDRFVGVILRSLYQRTNTGDGAGQLRHALDNRDFDVMIFGTSRARHHVDPSVLRQLLGVRSYNYGSNGRGIYYARIVERLLLARGTPARTFLLQAEPFDLYNVHPERASVCAPLVDEDPVAYDLLAQATPWGALKLRSRTYRFNAMVFPIIFNLVAPESEDRAGDGFVGLSGDLKGVNPADPFEAPLRQYADKPFASEALGLYRDFVEDARRVGIRVVLFGGPWFRVEPPPPAEARAIQAFRDLANSERVPYLPLDEHTFPELVNPEFFRDRDHLNASGAHRFSELLAAQLEAAQLVTPSSAPISK